MVRRTPATNIRPLVAVLDDLDQTDYREYWYERDQRITNRRDYRQNHQAPRHADEAQEPRDEEGLQDERDKCDPEIEVAVEPGDQGFFARIGDPRSDLSVSPAYNHLGQDVFTDRVDPIEQHDEQRD